MHEDGVLSHDKPRTRVGSAALSRHLEAEIAYAHRSGRKLEPGEPVPGCLCWNCTGIREGEPQWARRVRDPTREAKRERWIQLVEEARKIPVLEVTQRLGCGKPCKRGSELAVLCPLHKDSNPSLRIDTDKEVWYCDPCGEGGDAIELYAMTRRVGFVETVQQLTRRCL